MVKQIYMTLAALAILGISVNAAPSKLEMDYANGNQGSFTRLRREAEVEPAKEPTNAETTVPDPAPAEESVEGDNTVPSVSTVSTTRKPVLVLIRDALKKVTSGLPTEQVATNALQYFQLFEHFIQQTIEQVLESADDDEDEKELAKPSATVTPTADKDDDDISNEDVLTSDQNTQTEKQTEDTTNSSTSSIAAPAEIPTENEVKPVETEATSNAV